MSHRLKFTNRFNERYYFVALSEKPWPYRPALRMIQSTTSDPAKAAEFVTIAEAQETYERCGEPDGWEIEPVPSASGAEVARGG